MWGFFILLSLIISCNSPKKGVELKPEEVKELFKTRGCTDCHDKGRDLIGPSFMEIAKRYKEEGNAENILLRSLREGSCKKWKARWKCMPPQRVEEEEAKHMIKWILTLEPQSSR